MDAHDPQEVVLEHEQIQHNTLSVPRDGNHACARDSVEYEVVGGGNNGCQDETRVGHAANDQSQPLPAAELDGHRGHRESDEERVTEVEGWHGRWVRRVSLRIHGGDEGLWRSVLYSSQRYIKEFKLTVLVAEPVRGPHAALAIRTMNRIDKTVTLGLLCVRPIVCRVAQQPRWHAGPAREDDEGEEVAHGHGPSPLLIQGRVERRATCRAGLAR